jgi:hypothetical protein
MNRNRTGDALRVGAAFLGALLLVRGVSYLYYLTIGSRILAGTGHIPDTPLPAAFIVPTMIVDFCAGALAGSLVVFLVKRLAFAVVIGIALTAVALLQMSSPHVNEWLMQLVPLAGVLTGAAVMQRRLTAQP